MWPLQQVGSIFRIFYTLRMDNSISPRGPGVLGATGCPVQSLACRAQHGKGLYPLLPARLPGRPSPALTAPSLPLPLSPPVPPHVQGCSGSCCSPSRSASWSTSPTLTSPRRAGPVLALLRIYWTVKLEGLLWGRLFGLPLLLLALECMPGEELRQQLCLLARGAVLPLPPTTCLGSGKEAGPALSGCAHSM